MESRTGTSESWRTVGSMCPDSTVLEEKGRLNKCLNGGERERGGEKDGLRICPRA